MSGCAYPIETQVVPPKRLTSSLHHQRCHASQLLQCSNNGIMNTSISHHQRSSRQNPTSGHLTCPRSATSSRHALRRSPVTSMHHIHRNAPTTASRTCPLPIISKSLDQIPQVAIQLAHDQLSPLATQSLSLAPTHDKHYVARPCHPCLTAIAMLQQTA